MASLTFVRPRKIDLLLCILFSNGPIFPLCSQIGGWGGKVVFNDLPYYFSDGFKSYCDIIGSWLLLPS